MINKRRKRAARKQRLQELTVQKARPEAKTYLIWDTKQTHLALQVQPTGSKAWKCIYSRHGRPRWIDPVIHAAVAGFERQTRPRELPANGGRSPS